MTGRKVILAFSISLLLICFFVSPQIALGAKEEDGQLLTNDKYNISMSVKYGYDNKVKYGRYSLVSGEIENSGEKSFTGVFQVMVPKSTDNTLYQEEVTVRPGETKKVSLVLPIVDDTGYLQVKLWNKKSTVLEHTYQLTFGNYDKLVYAGVLTEERENLDYLERLNLKTFYLTEDTLSDNPLGLDLLDVLIINNFNVSKLSTEQVQAITTWVNNGGTLVLGAGNYNREVSEVFKSFQIAFGNETEAVNISLLSKEEDLKGLKQHILDCQKSRRMFLLELSERNQRLISSGNKKNLTEIITGLDLEYRKRELSEEKISGLEKTVAAKQITTIGLDGGRSLIKEAGRDLLLCSKVSSGRVQLFAFDLGLAEEKEAIALSIISQITEHISEDNNIQLDNEYYGWYMTDGLMNSIASAKEKLVPATYKYFIIIAVYLLISGPVTYFYLKKKKKQGMGLIIVSVMVVVFTLIIYAAGTKTRITKPYAEYIRIQDYTDAGMDKIDLSLTMPNNYDYTLNLTRRFNLVEMTNANPYITENSLETKADFDNADKIIRYESKGVQLTVTNNPAFNPVSFQGIFQTTKEGAGIRGQLTHIGSGINGTLRNDYDYDISNAILICDGRLIDIGYLKKGQEINLRNEKGTYLLSIDDLYSTSLIKGMTELSEEGKDGNENTRLNQLISLMVEYNFTQGEYSNCIIGLKENGQESNQTAKEGDQLLSQISSVMKTEGTTLVKLPVKVDHHLADKEYVYTIDNNIQAEGMKMNGYYAGRYMTNDSIIHTYQFPAEEKIINFSFAKAQNLKVLSKYTQNFGGSVFFLNVDTGRYEEVFNGIYDIDIKASDYLTEDNILTVRYRQESSLQEYQVVLPHISYWKEAD